MQSGTRKSTGSGNKGRAEYNAMALANKVVEGRRGGGVGETTVTGERPPVPVTYKPSRVYTREN